MRRPSKPRSRRTTLKSKVADLNRRKFIRSLSRTALVLALRRHPCVWRTIEQQQAARKKIGPQERSYDAKPAPPPPGPKSPIEGTPLGVSFVDVAKEAGLDIEDHLWRRRQEQVSAGNHRLRRCLLRLRQRWMARYLPRERLAAGGLSERAQEPHCHLFKNNRDGTFTDVTADPEWSTRPAGARPAASATTTTTAMTICSSLTTGRTRSIATTATGPLRM
jgi:hypothetical protein